MSIAAGWIVLVVMLLRLLLKKAPKAIRCLLWAVVGLRLVCPFSFESVLSLIPSAETLSPEMLYAKVPTIHTGVAVLNSTVNPVFSEAFATEGLTSVNPLQVAVFLTSTVWIIGMAAMLIYTLISTLRLRAKVGEAVEWRDNIWLCDRIDTPFIFGLFRPRILLPSSMAEIDMEYVIAHEKAHLKRHDHWWKPIGFVLLTVYWFNPLLWAAYILFCRDIEMACDERVIKEMGSESKKPYSQALIRCSAPRQTVAACPLAFGEVGVKKRVQTILDYKKPAFWLVMLSVVICTTLAVCFLTDPLPVTVEPNQDVFSVDQYATGELIYDCGIYSSTQVSTPFYRQVEENKLQMSHDGLEWTDLGEMTRDELTDENFDDRFLTYFDSLASLRINNATVWELTVERNGVKELYLMLKQKDGSRYMAYGYYGLGSEPTSLIRFVNRLEPCAFFVCKDSADPIPPSVLLLEETKTFQFTYSALSSYLAIGEYEIAADTLILRTDDGQYTYVFAVSNNLLVFDADASSPLPEYRYSADLDESQSPVPDGAIFTQATYGLGEFGYAVKDRMTFDIDDDGREEECFLGYGPTSGLITYRLSVWEGDEQECFNIFYTRGYSLSFGKGSDGKVYVCAQNNSLDPSSRIFDISFKDGNVVLSENGIPLEYWGEQGIDSIDNT